MILGKASAKGLVEADAEKRWHQTPRFVRWYLTSDDRPMLMFTPFMLWMVLIFLLVVSLLNWMT